MLRVYESLMVLVSEDQISCSKMVGCENDFMDIYMVMDCQCPITNNFSFKVI
jgi:hypothetical protein